MNTIRSDEDNALLGSNILEVVSQPQNVTNRDYIALNLPFPLEEMLEQDNISDVMKLKLKIAHDTINLFFKYPYLHSLGLMFMDSKYSPSASYVSWDNLLEIKKTDAYKNSKLNCYAFTHNFMNGKRHIKFIRDTHNNLVSFDDIVEDMKSVFSYVNDGKNSYLLHQNLKSLGENAGYISFNSSDWDGYPSKVSVFSVKHQMEHFLGKEFINALAYNKLDDTLPKQELVLLKPKKI